jgi:hypothetical protein
MWDFILSLEGFRPMERSFHQLLLLDLFLLGLLQQQLVLLRRIERPGENMDITLRSKFNESYWKTAIYRNSSPL